MTAKQIHRVVTAVLASLTGVAALLSATDPTSLDVSSTAWAWIAMVLAIAIIVVTAARQALDPEA